MEGGAKVESDSAKLISNHALSITTQRQVWATSLLSQIRQLYYALVAKEVVTESIDSRGREGWVSVLAL